MYVSALLCALIYQLFTFPTVKWIDLMDIIIVFTYKFNEETTTKVISTV